MEKIVVLGNGLLGKELTKWLKCDNLSRQTNGLDITKPETWTQLLLDCHHEVAWNAKYTTIVNCIANTNTYSKDKQNHWDINYKGVADLVDFCNSWGIKLVQIVTDYIYAGSDNKATEDDVPVHDPSWYTYTKLLADGYVQLKSNNYLLLRGTHKPKPFPHEYAWADQFGNFDYVDVMADIITRLVNKDATGVYNVGTSLKNMYQLAKQTRPDVKYTYCGISSNKIPRDVGMNCNKMRLELGE